MQYLIRFAKYLIYLGIILTVFLALAFYTSSDRGELNYFWELIHPSNYWQVALFLVAFAAIYPSFGFIKRKVYLNHAFEKDRDTLIECILRANYRIESDNGKVIVFRQKSVFIRLIRMHEDAVTLDYSDNPIVLNGMRRDVYRFARSMDYLVRRMGRE